MTKIALIADTHFGTRNDNIAFYGYFDRSFQRFFDYIDKNDIKNVIHLGDLFDRRKFVNFLTAKACRELFLERIEQRGIRLDIILGNHDTYYKTTNEINSLDELVKGRYSNIHIHSKPTCIEIDNQKLLLLPWINDDNLEESMHVIEKFKTEAKFVFAHLDLQGFETHRGVIKDTGMDHNIFRDYTAVYTGHYHHRSFRSNINYIGAFCEFIWSDYNDPRGWTTLNIITGETEFIQNTESIFISYVYDENNKNMLKEIKNLNFSNKYVKIICVNKNDPYKFDQVFDLIEKQEPLQITMIDSVGVLSETSDEIEIIDDTSTLISNYIDGLTLEIDSDRMKNWMRNLYLEAISLEYVE